MKSFLDYCKLRFPSLLFLGFGMLLRKLYMDAYETPTLIDDCIIAGIVFILCTVTIIIDKRTQQKSK